MPASAHDDRGPAPAAPAGAFTITPVGPFSLESSIRFLEGFAPAAYDADAPSTPEVTLDAAFALEGSWRTIGVSVSQGADGEVHGRVYSGRPLRRPELSAARSQVARILSLDVDGSAFAAVGEDDPVVGDLQRRYPGLRPVCFWSWYEAAAWTLISQRIRMTQAATIKDRMSRELGVEVRVGSVTRWAFPAPAVLAGLEGFAGLTAQKVDRLRALGEFARHSPFDSATLRAMDALDALDALRELPGVGPFSAELILLRGAGYPDRAPVAEPRLAAAVRSAYCLDADPTPEEVDELSQRWAPYRTWVTLLLRVALEDETRS